MNTRTLVLMGLGSNLPWQEKSSVDIVQDALDELEHFADDLFLTSSLYRTSPVDCPPGSADFINAAAAFTPRRGLTPESLLAATKALEKACGRGRAWQRNAPRPLDLDLLAFGFEVRDSAAFQLPHPRAVQRAFVLVPLAEIVPDYVWPGTEQTVAQLNRSLHSDEIVAPIPVR